MRANQLGLSFSNYCCRLIRAELDRQELQLDDSGLPSPIMTRPYIINENVSSADLRAAARAAENREIDEAHRLIVEGATAEVLREEQRSKQNKKAARQA